MGWANRVEEQRRLPSLAWCAPDFAALKSRPNTSLLFDEVVQLPKDFPMVFSLRRLVACCVVVLGSAGLACDHHDSPDSSQQRGELGGTFGEACADETRNVCNPNPSRDGVALGSTFSLVYQPGDSTATVERIEPVSEDQISLTSDGRLLAHREGLAGLIVRKPLGDVVDYTFVQVRKAGNIILVTPSSVDSDVGDVNLVGSRELAMRLSATDGTALLGFVPVEVRAERPDLVEVTSVVEDRIRLTAKGVGETTLVIEGAGLERRINVHASTGETQ